MECREQRNTSEKNWEAETELRALMFQVEEEFPRKVWTALESEQVVTARLPLSFFYGLAAGFLVGLCSAGLYLCTR